MRIKRTTTLTIATLLLAAATFGSTGCILGGNSNFNIIVPTGFGGNPGFYNPFGLTQALVNALIGGSSSSGDSSSSSSSSSAGSTVPNAAVIGSLQGGYNGGTSTNNLTGSAAATPPSPNTSTP